MSEQPLYDLYYKSSTNKELTPEQKNTFIEKMSYIHDFELFFLLIKYYAQNHNEDEYPFPYNGKMLKKGLRFNLDELPNKLQQMLFNFLHAHLVSKNV